MFGGRRAKRCLRASEEREVHDPRYLPNARVRLEQHLLLIRAVEPSFYGLYVRQLAAPGESRFVHFSSVKVLQAVSQMLFGGRVLQNTTSASRGPMCDLAPEQVAIQIRLELVAMAV